MNESAIIGCDLSSWQRGIKISDIKAHGMEFAILRGGYTGTGSARSKNKDTCFDSFYEQAKACGMPIGVYYFSCARTGREGEAEAAFLWEHCLKGRSFEYPVYIDVESDLWQGADKAGVTDAILGFCGWLEAKGYFTGVYASLSWFKGKLDLSRLKGCSKWVAAWQGTKPELTDGYGMWQNSSTGKIGAYNIDTNIAYENYPKIIKAAGMNGFAAPAASDNADQTADLKREIETLQAEIAGLKIEIVQQEKATAGAAALLQQALSMLED